MNVDRAFLTLGAIVIVALICFTVLSAVGASGTGTMRDVLLGLVAGLSGGWALYRRGNNGSTTGSADAAQKPPAKSRASR